MHTDKHRSIQDPKLAARTSEVLLLLSVLIRVYPRFHFESWNLFDQLLFNQLLFNDAGRSVFLQMQHLLHFAHRNDR